MNTWILILTLAGQGSAIHAIPGFQDRASCMDAGRKWVETTDAFVNQKKSILCVERKK